MYISLCGVVISCISNIFLAQIYYHYNKCKRLNMRPLVTQQSDESSLDLSFQNRQLDYSMKVTTNPLHEHCIL